MRVESNKAVAVAESDAEIERAYAAYVSALAKRDLNDESVTSSSILKDILYHQPARHLAQLIATGPAERSLSGSRSDPLGYE